MGLAIIICSLISLIIGCSVLLGGSLVNFRFNQRIQPETCNVFCSVHSYWCRSGAFSNQCYDVMRNVKPNGTQCWQAPTIARFTSKDLADKYAASCSTYTFNCYWDPNNPCNYYDGYADVHGTLIAGIVFTSLGFVLGVGNVGYYYWQRRRKITYQTIT